MTGIAFAKSISVSIKLLESIKTIEGGYYVVARFARNNNQTSRESHILVLINVILNTLTETKDKKKKNRIF